MYSLHTKIALIGVVSMALLYVVGCNKQQDTLPIEPKQVEILTADPAVRIIIFNAYDNRGVPRFLESYLRNRVQNIVRIELREDWYAKSNYIKNSFSDGHTKIVVVESEHRRNAEKIVLRYPKTRDLLVWIPVQMVEMILLSLLVKT
jgi:hypothetical protein